jgi:hypothetical protein
MLKLFPIVFMIIIAGSVQHVLAQDQFSSKSGQGFDLDGADYQRFTSLNSKATKLFEAGKMAAAAEAYAEAVRAAKKASVVDVSCWYRFLKAAKTAGNAELLKEARADVAEMRSAPNSLFSDPYRGIKSVNLVLKNVPGSKWDGTSASVRARLEAELQKEGLRPVTSKQAAADAMIVEITSDTHKKGMEQYTLEAHRADVTHHLATGYTDMVAPIKSNDEMVPRLIQAIDQLAESVRDANIE